MQVMPLSRPGVPTGSTTRSSGEEGVGASEGEEGWGRGGKL